MFSTLRFPARTHAGWGAIAKLSSELQNWHPDKILLITDPTLVKIGLIDKIVLPLYDQYKVEIYTDVEPEPSLECAERLVEYTRDGGFECVVGIGGGSALDLAKLAAVISHNEGCVSDYLNLSGTKQLKERGLPRILVPTTSGTGSEVTDIAVLSLKGTKDVVTHDFLLADIAIADPELTMTVPKRVTAATGVDALTHAVEAYLSVNANETTDALALKAVSLIGESLVTAVQDGEDKKARSDMSYGSYLAGLAFFNAGVGGVHALAYPLGSQFKLPHGESNAVLLPYVMSYISSSCKDRLDRLCNILAGEKDRNAPDDYLHVFLNLVKETGLPLTLKEYGIHESDLAGLTEDAIKQKRLLARSPKKLDHNDIYQIYQMAHSGM